ncbi:MAG: VIT1/CCC1 transporter family protein [Hyphomonas sp.]
MAHHEHHSIENIGWLRAAILGANDGLISTASLVIGVAAAVATRQDALIAGSAGLVAGAFSMAAGEYVSVSSQSDAEKADLKREAEELGSDPDGELIELTDIYVARGVERGVAKQVAEQMTAHNALEAHARDELGITDLARARPIQAAVSSAIAFALGAVLPLLVIALAPEAHLIGFVLVATLFGLVALGSAGAVVGGAVVWRAGARVCVLGVIAMGASALIGHLIGASL